MFSTDLIHIIFFLFLLFSVCFTKAWTVNAALLRLLFVLFLINNNSTNEPNTTKKKRRKRANAHEFFHGNEKCHHKNYQLNRKTQKKKTKESKKKWTNKFLRMFPCSSWISNFPKDARKLFSTKKNFRIQSISLL